MGIRSVALEAGQRKRDARGVVEARWERQVPAVGGGGVSSRRVAITACQFLKDEDGELPVGFRRHLLNLTYWM